MKISLLIQSNFFEKNLKFHLSKIPLDISDVIWCLTSLNLFLVGKNFSIFGIFPSDWERSTSYRVAVHFQLDPKSRPDKNLLSFKIFIF